MTLRELHELELVLSIPVQFVFTAIRMYSYRYVAAHGDGGGWDAGTSYSFHPRMKYRFSVRNEMLTESFPDNRRKTGWVIYWAFNLIPGWGAICAILWALLFVIPFLWYYIFGYDHNMPNHWHEGPEE